MSRAQFCPLNYDTSMCYLPDAPCLNFRFCEYQTLSWALPYYLDDDSFLIVSNFPDLYRFTFNKFSQPVYHSIAFVDDSFSNIIRLAWQQAGWYPAVYNKNFVYNIDGLVYDSCLNPDYDPIPF